MVISHITVEFKSPGKKKGTGKRKIQHTERAKRERACISPTKAEVHKVPNYNPNVFCPRETRSPKEKHERSSNNSSSINERCQLPFETRVSS